MNAFSSFSRFILSSLPVQVTLVRNLKFRVHTHIMPGVLYSIRFYVQHSNLIWKSEGKKIFINSKINKSRVISRNYRIQKMLINLFVVNSNISKCEISSFPIRFFTPRDLIKCGFKNNAGEPPSPTAILDVLNSIKMFVFVWNLSFIHFMANNSSKLVLHCRQSYRQQAVVCWL